MAAPVPPSPPGWGRRRFLGLLAAGAGAVALGGCSDDDGPSTTPEAGGERSTTTDPVDHDAVPPAQGITADPFGLGVASGDPDDASVVLWTRLITDLADRSGTGGIAGEAITVRWEVADDRDADDGFDRPVRSGTATTSAATGHALHVVADGLDADRWYRYRFRVGDHVSPIGRTRTTPAAGAPAEALRLAFVSCQRRQGGFWTAFDHLAADEVDLVFHLGDYIYEYPGGDGDLAVALDEEPATLADYRLLYASYQRDPKLQAAQAAAPWVITWDDHEVENNYAASIAERPADQAAFAARRRAAYQAFWEHHPIRTDPPAADGSLQVYRELRFGSLATFLVLDGRQYRSDQTCGDEIVVDTAACPERLEPDRTMLGADQERWLADRLAAADGTWTVLAQQTVMKALLIGDVVLNVDQWDGYPAARARLLQDIADLGVQNVVVLTGDIHVAGAADLRLPDAGTTGTVVAHELVGPAISSESLAAAVGASFDLSAMGLAYSNLADHGYVRATVTPERWRAEWVMVDTIAEATSGARIDATAEIVAGTPGLRML